MRRHNNRRNGKVWIAQGENVEPYTERALRTKEWWRKVNWGLCDDSHCKCRRGFTFERREGPARKRINAQAKNRRSLLVMLQKSSAAASKELWWQTHFSRESPFPRLWFAGHASLRNILYRKVFLREVVQKRTEARFSYSGGGRCFLCMNLWHSSYLQRTYQGAVFAKSGTACRMLLHLQYTSDQFCSDVARILWPFSSRSARSACIFESTFFCICFSHKTVAWPSSEGDTKPPFS